MPRRHQGAEVGRAHGVPDEVEMAPGLEPVVNDGQDVLGISHSVRQFRVKLRAQVTDLDPP